MTHLVSNWEQLSFIELPSSFESETVKQTHFAIEIAFRLSKPIVLYEVSQTLKKNWRETPVLLTNALFALIEMDSFALIEYIFKKLSKKYSDPWFLLLKNLLGIVTENIQKPLTLKLDLFFKVCQNKSFSQVERCLLTYLLKKGVTCKKSKETLPYFAKIDKKMFLPLYIRALLFAEKTQEAGKALTPLYKKHCLDVSSPYHILYGCYLTQLKGEKEGLSHFQEGAETRFPSTRSLLCYFLKGHIDLKSKWANTAFLFEKISLFKDLSLYYFCAGKKRKSEEFEEMIEKEQLTDQIPLNFL